MERATALEQLRRELGAQPPPAIAGLDEQQLETLAEILATSRRQQSEALTRAIDEGLGFVPRLLRGGVKKALFG